MFPSSTRSWLIGTKFAIWSIGKGGTLIRGGSSSTNLFQYKANHWLATWNNWPTTVTVTLGFLIPLPPHLSEGVEDLTIRIESSPRYNTIILYSRSHVWPSYFKRWRLLGPSKCFKSTMISGNTKKENTCKELASYIVSVREDALRIFHAGGNDNPSPKSFMAVILSWTFTSSHGQPDGLTFCTTA